MDENGEVPSCTIGDTSRTGLSYFVPYPLTSVSGDDSFVVTVEPTIITGDDSEATIYVQCPEDP
jgi:hypothetical protein